MNFVTTNELTESLSVTPQRISALSKQCNVLDTETIIKGRNRHYLPLAVKKILSHRGIDYDVRKILCFCNNKGGIGKTSIAINTALRLSSLGFKVLLIDADAQANASSFLLNNHSYSNVLYNVVAGECKIEDAIIKISDTLGIIPSNLQNSRLDTQLTGLMVNHRTYFSNMLKGLDYNYIIWDLSPSISTANFFAILSCSEINIITTLSDFSVQGLEMTFDVIKNAQESFVDFKPLTRALINMFDSRITTALELLNAIKSTGIEIFSSVIRVDNNVGKAQISKSPLTPSSNAHKDICKFVNELIELFPKTQPTQ